MTDLPRVIVRDDNFKPVLTKLEAERGVLGFLRVKMKSLNFSIDLSILMA